MKYVILQGDGMADRPDAQGLTPLARAHTPHLDRVARCGEHGLVRTIPEGYPPGSDVGNLSLFGFDPRRYYGGRSPLEAAAMGVDLGADDISFRMNLVALSNERDASEKGASEEGAIQLDVMADYSAGHIAKEDALPLVEALAAAWQKERDATLRNGAQQDAASGAVLPELAFYPGLGYRHLMVWRGGREHIAAAGLRTTPPHDITGQAIASHLPQQAAGEEQKDTVSGVLRRVMRLSREVFAGHPANRRLRAEGQVGATQVWLWGEGSSRSLPSFSRRGLRGGCISAVDVVRGVAKLAGFSQIEVPGATGFLDTDYAAKGRYALTNLKHYDLIFLHVEAPDEAGHMGDCAAKIAAIESIDAKILGPLLEGLPSFGAFRIVITSDHATPWQIKTHTPEAVPFAMADAHQLRRSPEPASSLRPRVEGYSEREASGSGIFIEHGDRLMDRLLMDPLPMDPLLSGDDSADDSVGDLAGEPAGDSSAGGGSVGGRGVAPTSG